MHTLLLRVSTDPSDGGVETDEGRDGRVHIAARDRGEMAPTMAITLEQADRAIAAAKKRADELGVKVGISVVDSKGDLVAFARHGAGAFTVDASRGKAMTAAMFHAPSATYGTHGSEPHPRVLRVFPKSVPTQASVCGRRSADQRGRGGARRDRGERRYGQGRGDRPRGRGGDLKRHSPKDGRERRVRPLECKR